MDANGICLLLAVALPLAGAPLIAIAGRPLGRRVGWLAFAFPVISCGALLCLAARMNLPGSLVIEWPWIPSLGINFSFLLDGLSLFFALIVSGVGVLIFFYANFYLDDHYKHHGRFYCYLTLFMAAMLGTVLGNNLMLLFVFWELTGLASFLLIGFLHHEEKSRVGARQALLITAFTGLLMLAGVIMLRQVTGTYDLAALLGSGLPMAEHKNWLTAAMLLMLLGAFGKSAQFPMQFWLPNAMAAPTPVSAYLHSATMVKLGVFLCARIFPLFVENELWAPVLTLVAFTTMLLGAVLALLSHDLKAILAYSTVSQLGYLIGYYGLGSLRGVEYDFLHVLNHVFYKGCLFMVAGIVIHATGVQDIRQLGGLRRRMPLLAVVCAAAAATMAGLPGTTGFLSKETMLKEIFDAMGAHGGLGAYATACVVVTSLVKVAFSCRFFANVFLGGESEAVKKHFHAQPFAIQLPPLLLAGSAVLLGVWPGLLNAPIHWLSVEGLHQPTPHLALWHGVTTELLVSVAVVLLGFGVFYAGERTAWRWAAIPRLLRFDDFFEAGIERFSKFTKKLTRTLRADAPVDYLPVIIAFLLCVVGGFVVYALRPGLAEFASRIEWNSLALHPLRSFVAGLIALAVIGVLILQRWTTQLISLSVAGFLTTFYYVLYRAPDLALTQILIEVVTLFLILILLGRFPRSAELGEIVYRPSSRRKKLNVCLSLGVGALMTTFILWFNPDSTVRDDRIGQFFAANTVALAEGNNAVNTILVDFRGFDTLGEITVLVIAMLGGIGLLMRYKRTPEEYREGPMGPPGLGIKHSESAAAAGVPPAVEGGILPPGSAHDMSARLKLSAPLPPGGTPGSTAGGTPAATGTGTRGPRSFIFDSMARVTFFLVNVFALYLLLRGHNAPGGGFIAGLATAISLILLSLTVGVETMHRLLRFDPVLLAAGGLVTAAGTGMVALFAGAPFLEHFNFHLHGLPLLGELHVGTPLLFDAGVYLVVVGVTCKMIFVFAKSTQGLRALVAEEERRYSSPVEQPIEDDPGPEIRNPKSEIRKGLHAT